jgi:hypothetical protein
VVGSGENGIDRGRVRVWSALVAETLRGKRKSVKGCLADFVSKEREEKWVGRGSDARWREIGGGSHSGRVRCTHLFGRWWQ